MRSFFPHDIIKLIVRELDPRWLGVARLISKSFAEAIREAELKDGRRFPVDVASLCSRMDLLLWARGLGCPWGRSLLVAVARAGDLGMLQWAAESLGKDLCDCLDETIFASAAGSGGLDKMEWLSSQGCRMGPGATAAAARAGSLDALSWLRARRCPWNMSTCTAAAEGGHADVLAWAIDQRCPHSKAYTAACAARLGRIGVLEWAWQRRWTFTAFACEQAARAGQLEALRWLRGRGCPWNR